MASLFYLLRTCGLIFYLYFQVFAVSENVVYPRIVSLKVEDKSCDLNRCKYLLKLRGGEFLGHSSWRLTPVEDSRGGSCDIISPNYELREISTDQWDSTFSVIIPYAEGKTFFCVHERKKKNSPFGEKWVHQGGDLFLDPKNDVLFQVRGADLYPNQSPKETGNLEISTKWADLSHDTDVNQLPSARAARHERADIEVYLDDKYVPLTQISENNVLRDFSVKDNVNIHENHERNVNSDVNYDNNVNSGVNYGNNVNSQSGIEDDTFESWNLNANYMSRKKRNVYNEDVIKIEENVKSKSNPTKNQLESPYTSAEDQIIKTEVNKIVFEQTTTVIHPKFVESNLRNVLNIPIETGTNKSDIKFKDKLTKTVANYYNQYSSNTDDDLITPQDILKAKIEFQNAVKPFQVQENQGDVIIKVRKEREVTPEHSTTASDSPTLRAEHQVAVEGLRVEFAEKEPKTNADGTPSVLAGQKITLRIFGEGLTKKTVITFTYDQLKYGEPCKFLVKGEYMIKPDSLVSKSGLFDIVTPPPMHGSKLYICAKNLKSGNADPLKDEEKYVHQGTEPFKTFETYDKFLPLWASLILILVLLMFSALFSGLNLGLMSLDRTELKIIANTGTDKERKYARAIMPVRDHGNYLLCSILLGNVAVNSTFTILLDDLTSGLFAVIFSTLAIVLLGEITPQAVCSRHGLMIGAKSIMVTKAVMGITAPLAFPVSKLLDYFLGEEIGSVYNRERLKELVKVTTDVNDLDKDEVNIISGALELRKKTVSDIMTKLEDVFMLPITSVLDFETMSEIIKSGYSRIPVYEGHRGNIVTVLFIKDLAFVDPDDNTPLRTLCQYYQNPCNFVFEDVTLDVMFRQFKDGHKGHMAFIHRINNEGEGDPFYETIGLVTLEDVIEEMIQAEIVDETDVFMDNRTKRKRNRPQNKLQDFLAFAERHENHLIRISPQLTLATFQFLSTSVDAFRPDTVSETVLRRLLRQDVIQYIKIKGKSKKDPSTYVFQQGKPVDYFVLILEGRVEVTVGRENLVFEAGPFTYFGVQALTQNVGVAESPTPSAMGSLQNINMDSMLRHTFVPDYSVRAITEVYYLTVKRSLYLAAKRATLMEKGVLSKGATNEQFDTEVDKHLCHSSSANIPISLISKKFLGKSTSMASTKEDFGSTSASYKLLQSVDEDISISGEHKTPSRQVSPNPLPVSASPHTRASFASHASRASPEPRAGNDRADEQEKLLKSP